MSVIITRHGQYLNERYKWGVIPHLFPEWQVSSVLDLVDRWKDKPEGFAMVEGTSIDLDRLEVIKL